MDNKTKTKRDGKKLSNPKKKIEKEKKPPVIVSNDEEGIVITPTEISGPNFQIRARNIVLPTNMTFSSNSPIIIFNGKK